MGFVVVSKNARTGGFVNVVKCWGHMRICPCPLKEKTCWSSAVKKITFRRKTPLMLIIVIESLLGYLICFTVESVEFENWSSIIKKKNWTVFLLHIQEMYLWVLAPELTLGTTIGNHSPCQTHQWVAIRILKCSSLEDSKIYWVRERRGANLL